MKQRPTPSNKANLSRFIRVLFFLALVPITMNAQWQPIRQQSATPLAPEVTIISDDENSTVLKVELSGYDIRDFVTDGKTYQVIDLLTETFSTKTGYPELPYIAKVLAVPDQAVVSVEVIETGKIVLIDNINLRPARESWIEGDAETAYVENAEAYRSSDAYPSEFSSVDPPSIFRDFRIARVSINPMRYFASTQQLQVATSITVRVNYGVGEAINPKAKPAYT